VHDDWGLDQQFLHRTIVRRGAHQRDAEVNYDSGVRIGRWVSIPKLNVKPVAMVSSHQTTSQFKARVEWSAVRRPPARCLFLR
jgi:hypothetical protein